MIYSALHNHPLSARSIRNILQPGLILLKQIRLIHSQYRFLITVSKNIAYEINLAAAKIARVAADEYFKGNPQKYRFVAGSIGPTNRTASMSPDANNPAFRAVTFDDLVNAYIEQVEGLMDGNVDMLLIETIFDTLNAKAALFALTKVFEKKRKSVPVMVSVTITDASGRTLSGQTLEAFFISISHFPFFQLD